MPLFSTQDRESVSSGTTYSIAVSGVFDDGTIIGEWTLPDQHLRMFVAGPDAEVPLGCNCHESRGKGPCWHTCAFVNHLMKLLYNPSSFLSQKIRQRSFDRHKPDPSWFHYDPAAHVQRLLKGLEPRLLPLEEPEEDVALPPIAESTPSRIAWNVVIQRDVVDIIPILQQAKKRGDGWTKGRRIGLDNLHQHADVFTESDQRLERIVQLDSSFYRPTFELDAAKALKILVNAPNVLLNGAPAIVASASVALELKSDAEHCWVELDGMHLGVSRYVFLDDCFIHFRPDQFTINVTELTRAQVESLRAILKLPKIPIAFQANLIESVQRLQSLLAIRLPETVAGKLVAEEYRPVLLLRSRLDGTLDFGVRLRDSANNLIKPAKGRMLRLAERDGQRVQISRSAARELAICQETSQRFGLPTDEFEGSIKDFETALDLIGRLQETEAESDVEILWDKSSEKPLRVLGAVSANNVSVGVSRKRDWFQLNGSCRIGKQEIELLDLLNGLRTAGIDGIRGDYVRLGEQGWAKVSQSLRRRFSQLHDAVNQERGSLKFDASSAVALRDLLSEDVDFKASRAWKDCLGRLEQAEKLDPVLPKGLNAELRDYQLEGFKWLRRLAEWGVGGILADDMGLGKTLQTLAVVLDRSADGPSLVIAPTSVGFNWLRECQKFAPQLEPHLYRETDRQEFLQTVGPGSLVVCSYGLALRDAPALAQVKWSTLILDEAQAIKNSRSKTSAAIATITADWKVALTGTPVENHLGELWSLFRVIAPGVLGGWEQFRRRFAAPIEKDNDEERRLALRDRLKPFLLRRTKKQVLKDLPPRTEMNLNVELQPDERELYDQVRMSALTEVEKIVDMPDAKDQRFRILALMTRLRQLACSPKLIHENWNKRSSKLQQLLETLTELREEGHRVLVFSQFVQYLTLIREMLEEEQISYEYLDGSTTAKARQQRVDSFQEGDATVFLISLKAGGTGLNLTAADYVIHMDPWWNPAVEDQATDRAHRIGQERPVMVYRLVSEGTIEEEILRLHETKRDLVAGVMEGTAAAGKLSTEDLIALLRG